MTRYGEAIGCDFQCAACARGKIPATPQSSLLFPHLRRITGLGDRDHRALANHHYETSLSAEARLRLRASLTGPTRLSDIFGVVVGMALRRSVPGERLQRVALP